MDSLIRAEGLMSRFVEGIASNDEIVELERLIIGDAAVADAFARETRFDSVVQELFRETQTERKTRETLEVAEGIVSRAIDENSSTAPSAVRGRLGSRRRLIAAGSLAALAVTFFVPVYVVMSISRDQRLGRRIAAQSIPIVQDVAAQTAGVPVAVVTQKVGARFSAAGFSPAVGDQFRTGLYRLTSGIVELTFPHSEEIILEAPCEFHLKGRELMVLHRGRISAKFPKGVSDFTIETPSATLNEQGTEFAVQVDEKDDSEVHVFDGIVSVTPRSGGAMHPTVLRGQSASAISKRSSTPCGIDVDRDRFLRSLSEPDSTYARLVLQSNPALYYRMTPTGEVIVDSGPQGIHASVIRGDSQGSPWTVGRIGAAMQFGGPAVKDYVVVPDYPKSKDGTLSVAAWVFANSRPRSATIAKNWSREEQGQFHFGLCGDTGRLEIFISDGEGREVSVREKNPMTIGRWQHVAFVADGKTLRLYRNGVEVGSADYFGLRGDPKLKTLQIGGEIARERDRSENSSQIDDDPAFSDYWHGRIDEFAVFNHALDPEQIRQLFSSIE